jgi:hypothetical protein
MRLSFTRMEAAMRKITKILAVFAWLVLIPSAFAKKAERPALPPKVLQANSVYVDCECPRALAVAHSRAIQQLQEWGRFQVVESPRQADLIFLFSGNPYLGDYLTRDGPDKRPVFILSTIMTIIDPKTGAGLWTDERRWGSWRVDGATKDLIQELRDLMESQARRWTLNDLLMCSVTPAYKSFAHVTPEEAMKADPRVALAADRPDRLRIDSPTAPEFCKSAELIVGADHTISGFEVSATQADDLDLNEVLQQADRFDFTGGKFANGDKVYFSAQSKDKKVLIQFDVQGHRSILSTVTYYY